ncbi:MAG: DNA polymerase I [Planctomycetota bacterium]|nr:DNA polymerase I [Planctomycetota bacterium]
MSRRTLWLIDGYAQFFRAFHAIRTDMRSPVTSEPTNMTYGFVDMLLKLQRTYRPDHLAVVLDVSGDRGTFRSEIFPEYKANRDAPPSELEPQVDRCLELLDQLGIPTYGSAGFEADDVIATIVRRMSEEDPDLDVRIVSKDKDLQQLLGEHVRLVDVHKDTSVGPEELLEEKGITPGQVIDMLALMGDTVDNVPGVPGIGPKTAAMLVAEHGSIEGVYATIDAEEDTPVSRRTIRGKRRENLVSSRDSIGLSRTLVTLREDCPVDFDLAETRCDPASADGAAFDESLRVLGFNRLRDAFRELLGGPPPTPAPAAENDATGTLFGAVDPPTTDPTRPVDGTYEVVTDRKTLEQVIDRAIASGRVAIDTETDGLRPRSVPLVGVSLAFEAERGFYVPLLSPSPDRHLDLESARPALTRLLTDPAVAKIGHNLKFDLVVLRSHGFEVSGVAGDSMIASYVEDATRASHAMDALSETLLGRRCVPITAVIGKGREQRLFSEVPLDVSAPYAAEDADITLRLETRLLEELRREGLEGLYRDTELPLVAILADLEYAGIAVDAEELDRQREALGGRIEDLRTSIVDAAPHPFNPDSPKQLAAALFNAADADPPGLGLRPVKKGKTGPSTDAEVMEKLADDPAVDTPIPDLILEYRQLVKLVGTYLVALKEAIDPTTGRIHASFNQTVTATGRLSSSDPNLQNIPIRTEVGRDIRKAFTAPPGRLLLAADYSQVELRMLAHLSGDRGLREAFERGEDIHAAVASQVLQVPLGEVDAEMRSTAKMINFGIVYGITGYGLARRLGGDMDVPTADGIITDYKARFPGIRNFLDACVDQARTHGWVETILGRRRRIPQITARNPMERQLGERMAINTVVQGSAADLIKRAMIDVAAVLPETHPDARMILQIHDELVLEVAEEEVEAVADRVRTCMEQAMDLEVPLVAEPSWGRTWAATK